MAFPSLTSISLCNRVDLGRPLTCRFIDSGCRIPRARSDPVGESEPKPQGRPFNSFILHFIKFYFSKVSRPESPARPEWRIRTGARFTPTFLFILLKRLINLFSCGSGFSFGQAHNHLQISKQFGRPINVNKIHLQRKAFYALSKMINKKIMVQGLTLFVYKIPLVQKR